MIVFLVALIACAALLAPLGRRALIKERKLAQLISRPGILLSRNMPGFDIIFSPYIPGNQIIIMDMSKINLDYSQIDVDLGPEPWRYGIYQRLYMAPVINHPQSIVQITNVT